MAVVMEDVQGLIKSSYLRDTIQLQFLKRCAYYKPIQLREVDNEAEYQLLKKDGFYGLAVSYDLADSVFSLKEVDAIAQIRFVELLASLTLYHFSKASKNTYRECLDIRGLEFCSTRQRFDEYRRERVPVEMNGFEGQRTGYPTDLRFIRYSVYFSVLNIHLDTYFREKANFAFYKKVKSVYLSFAEYMYDVFLEKACSILITPEVENVGISSSFYGNMIIRGEVPPVTLTQVSKFLDSCINVKTLQIESDQLGFPFSEYKALVEDWSRKAKKLEIFKLEYDVHKFQLHNHTLMRCVRSGNDWFLTDKWDIYAGIEYRRYFDADRCCNETTTEQYPIYWYPDDEHRYSHDFERHLETVLPFHYTICEEAASNNDFE